MVHVLVGMNFQYKAYELLELENPNLKIEANHKDRNTLNPNNNNIEWTYENQNKRHMHLTNNFKFGGKNFRGKISNDVPVETIPDQDTPANDCPF